ncbi:MAG TPA: lytic transglycosylase domain-containing protein [Thermoanaerobaculia bacterium]|nr:lytic transglycosylase domain-containing protein [Thermoanaerobaculia bacterium]
MAEKANDRKFEQRLLDGFDRSRIRQEVMRSRKGDSGWLKKRYATMMLGASLAVGGIGIPMKASKFLNGFDQQAQKTTSSTRMVDELADDIHAAGEIAQEVSGGVASAAHTAAATITSPLRASTADHAFNVVTEAAKERFFRSEVPFGSIIYSEAKKNDIKPELLAAVVQTESRFVPTARSHRGAIGLMQMLPKTGRWMGASDLTNPAQNVQAGAKYLRYLNDRFDGDQKKVIAAYNAGEGNVRRFHGIPPFSETRKYVDRVLGHQQDFQDQFAGKVAETIASAATTGAATADMLK